MRLVDSTPGLIGLATATCVCSIAAFAACITAPPPDLPQLPIHRPTILHDSVVPPEENTLYQLPTGGFFVPIQLDELNESYVYNVFVDYSPQFNSPPVYQNGGAGSEAGVSTVNFELSVASPQLEPTHCHRIEFLVAHGFNPSAPHTYDSVGGDLAFWTYNPTGDPCDSPVYDAGALQDGAFPDSASDGPLIVPESGSEP